MARLAWGLQLLLFGAAASDRPLFGPYKDTGVNMNWNTYEISATVRGNLEPALNVLPAGVDVMTWAFASGKCGEETWSGLKGEDIAKANVAKWSAAGQKYIISTGGQIGHFTCETDVAFDAFMTRYYSTSMVGVDFDIEGSQTQAEIEQLVARVKAGLVRWPSMRWSWTLATLGTATDDNLGAVGRIVMKVLKEQQIGWNNVFINLMVMDYGSAIPSVCTVVNGKCDMGLSAINAAESLHRIYGVPYSSIELTPMIGGNDVIENVFSLADTETISAYALRVGLGGLHHWSLDRDVDCAAGSWASATCNSYGTAGPLGFTKTFIKALGGGVVHASPVASPVRSPAASPARSSSVVSPSISLAARIASPLRSASQSPIRASPARSASPRPSASRSPSPRSASPKASPVKPALPSASPSPAPAGSCGTSWGAKCAAGYCCSSSGFCGQGSAYCGTGCQAAFGQCDAVTPTAASMTTKGRWLEPQSMTVPSSRSTSLLISVGVVFLGAALFTGFASLRSSLRCPAPEGIDVQLLDV